MTREFFGWPKATHMGAEGPQPAKRACLPQGLEVGARSAPQLLVLYILTDCLIWQYHWPYNHQLLVILRGAEPSQQFHTLTYPGHTLEEQINDTMIYT